MISGISSSLSGVNPLGQFQTTGKSSSTSNTATLPQDQVSISETAKQAAADNTHASGVGDVDHDGDSH